MGLFAKAKGLLTQVVKPPMVPPAFDYFPAALDYVFPNEGGFSDHEHDHGGPTNFGITEGTLAKWRGHIVSPQDVRNMKADEAIEIYRKWYWTDVGLNLIRSKAIAICIFDQGILNGQNTAVGFAQTSANNCGASLVVDGMAGPLTLRALEKVNLAKFLNCYRNLLKEHFDAIVIKDPTQIENYKGWMNRANRLLTLQS